MNQLSTNKDGFEFIPFTDVTMASLPGWMGDIYEECFERSEVYEEQCLMAEYIPTRFMVIDFAFNFFDSQMYHYALNGNAPNIWEEIQGYHEEGMTEDEITEQWADWRSYNGGYGVPPSDCLESMFMRDINRGLNLYHFSYLLDDFDGNPYNAPERVIVKEWINPPIVKVW